MTMNESDWLTGHFEDQRSRLRAVAFRMLGSLDEADDAVQETWLRLSRSDVSDVANLNGWLTTVVARICLDVLRARKARREESLEPSLGQIRGSLQNFRDPEQEAMMVDSVGVALLLVLETLSPSERLAFVLHDVFAVPFDEIAPIVDRSVAATKKLASRARQRLQVSPAVDTTTLSDQRRVVEAFLAASRTGDMNALIAVLDPNVVRRADAEALPPGGDKVVHGAERVARETVTNTALAQFARIAMVNETVGLIVVLRRRLRMAICLTIKGHRVAEIDVIADPIRLRDVVLTPVGAAD
jgi:RNA polymerase sigma-70 factor (ECF subfamily)